jgi:hypothetical protein
MGSYALDVRRLFKNILASGVMARGLSGSGLLRRRNVKPVMASAFAFDALMKLRILSRTFEFQKAKRRRISIVAFRGGQHSSARNQVLSKEFGSLEFRHRGIQAILTLGTQHIRDIHLSHRGIQATRTRGIRHILGIQSLPGGND